MSDEIIRVGTVTDWRWHLSRDCASKVSREVFVLRPGDWPHKPCFRCVPVAVQERYEIEAEAVA